VPNELKGGKERESIDTAGGRSNVLRGRIGPGQLTIPETFTAFHYTIAYAFGHLRVCHFTIRSEFLALETKFFVPYSNAEIW
jgi:hypothetical protein